MSEYAIEVGTWEEFNADATAVRTAVFVEEQGVPESEELDGQDPDAVQFLARDEQFPVGTARLRFIAPLTARVERVAVRQSHRDDGVGSALMRAAEETARRADATEIELHAQTRVEAFYHRLGYETVSDEFEEAGIPHVEMRKQLG